MDPHSSSKSFTSNQRELDPAWRLWQEEINAFDVEQRLSGDNSINLTVFESSNTHISEKTIKANSELEALLDGRHNFKTTLPPQLCYICLSPLSSEEREQFNAKTLQILFEKLEIPPMSLQAFKDTDSLYAFGPGGSHISTQALFDDDGKIRKSFIWYQLPERSIVTYQRRSIANYQQFGKDFQPPGKSTEERVLTGTSNRICIVADHASNFLTVIVRNSWIPVGSSFMKEAIDISLRNLPNLSPTALPLSINFFFLHSALTTFTRCHNEVIFNIGRLEDELIAPTTSFSSELFRECHTLLLRIIAFQTNIESLSFISKELEEVYTQFYLESISTKQDSSVISQDHLWMSFRNMSRSIETLILQVKQSEKRANILKDMDFYFYNDTSNREAKKLTQNMAKNTETMKNLAELGRKENMLMADIARETRDDSFATKTISIVTMMYLPGAFLSSIFGMQLIQVENRQLTIVKEWPYFVGLTIGLTAITFGTWFIWLKSGKFSGELKAKLLNTRTSASCQDIEKLDNST